MTINFIQIMKIDNDIKFYLWTNCPHVAIQNSVVPNLGTVEIECQLKLKE